MSADYPPPCPLINTPRGVNQRTGVGRGVISGPIGPILSECETGTKDSVQKKSTAVYHGWKHLRISGEQSNR